MAVTGVWVVAENFMDLNDRLKMIVFGNEAMVGHREASGLLASTFYRERQIETMIWLKGQCELHASTMPESVKNSANPRNYPKDFSTAMYRSERRVSSVSVVKNRRARFGNNSYWCAPRKAGSKSHEKKVDDIPVKTDIEKPKKKRRKKVRTRKLRRIDVLAQPKFQNNLLGQKKCSPTVAQSPRKSRVPKVSTANDKKTHKSLKNDKGSMMQQLSTIMQSKKLQRRLFSLVTNKIKDMKNSGKVC